jgi:putative PIN family toxin of toxin-antitoxin system
MPRGNHGGLPDKERSRNLLKSPRLYSWQPSLASKALDATLSKPAVVLDTNVVLDWLVFRNPGGRALFDAIETRQVRWLVTASMHDELAHVLGRGVAATWSPDLGHIFESWRMLSEEVMPPNASGEATRLRCTDPDDQKFIDLALAGARWLVSRDRAVLKLGKRAGRLGVQFLTPERWSFQQE